jgi:tripartite-type tricarboxylate transporter receptor subunit TctC
VADFLPGYEASLVNGVGAPRGTPSETIEALNTAINAALADPEIQARLGGLGSTPLPVSAGDYAAMLAAETEKWARVIRFAGIKAE